MDSQPSKHVVLEDTPSDIVMPPIIPVQMPATQTLRTTSYGQAAVVPPIVAPVTIVEDPRSRMDRLERRIGQMRDPDEMILWDDLDDVPVATLPVGFRMPDIERYTGVGCPRIHLRLYSTVMRALGLDEAQLLTLFPLSLSGMTQRWYASLESSHRRSWEDLAQEFLRQYSFSGDTSVTRRELESLRQGSDESVFSFISRWREKIAEMIERPTERDQMSMFLRSLHPSFARHLIGVPFQDFRSLVQALFDVDDGISRGLCIDDLVIIPMRDHCRYPGVISHLYSIVILIQFSSTLLCILILSQYDLHSSFSVHRLSFERLKATGFLVPLAPRPLPSTLPPRFRAHEFCAFHQMAGHRTDYCASLRHTIQDLIDSGAVSFPILTTDTDLEYIEIRLLQLRFTMSDEIAPITLTTLYEMMMDLTRRVERIELILSGHPSSSRGAPGVAMPSLPHLTSSMFATLGASHPRPRPHSVFQQHSSSISLATPTRPPPQFQGPPVITVPQERFPPHRRCRRHFSDLGAPLSRVFETFQAMGFLAPLAPRALPDPVPPQFRLDLYCMYHQSVGHHTDRCTALRHAIQDIVDSGRLGIPSPICFLFLPQLMPCMQTPLHQ
ncbi:hypothetical protein CK203_113362 [Vitis vinifera]|uniref:Retrotransposon gag domain-containing protein n=1 Tax=Vitis vinifera TaxID=29760 RepID=A0A438FC92_VITVI|nr:hypothetical protein CK203_113362 [Vitis vinifera]